MTGIKDLNTLLSSMRPELKQDEYVFCTVNQSLLNCIRFDPIATFKEKEGLTLILSKCSADSAGLEYSGTYKMITLTVHSSLEAVGLTAAIATKLASKGISANVVAAYYHDHIFVQSERADDAILALSEFNK